MDIRIRQPPQSRRIIIGAGLFVLGIILVRSYSEGLGAVFLLTGLIVGIRGAVGPILTFFWVLAFVGLFVGWAYWIVPESQDYGFSDWARQNWWLFIYVSILVITPITGRYRNTEDSWKALRASYSGEPDGFGDRAEYPTLAGIMKIDDELFSIHVIVIQDGILITREDDGHLFFPWSRIRELRWVDHRRRGMQVEVERKTTIPLRLRLPWNERLSSKIPKTVRFVQD